MTKTKQKEEKQDIFDIGFFFFLSFFFSFLKRPEILRIYRLVSWFFLFWSLSFHWCWLIDFNVMSIYLGLFYA